MGTRFPSLEDFDEGQTSPIAAAGGLDFEDPAADFLSREKATLGADAALFASHDDNNLLGAGDAVADDSGMGGFESSFPSLDTSNDAVGPGGTITGMTEPYIPPQTNAYAGVTMQEEEEPQVVREWRERQALEIQRRDDLANQRKAETIEKAQKNIDDFYENYNQKRDKAIEETRREAQEFLDSRESTVAGGTSWERIAKLVDLSDKSVRAGRNDKSHFRSMLVDLRKDEKAPGASGF